MPLLYPDGVLHSLATLLLLLIILWHAAQGFRSSKHPWAAGEHPLFCSAPASISDRSRSALGYAAVQLLGWQSLIAIYLVAVAPIVAPRIAAVTLAAQKVAKPMEWESWVVLIGGMVSVMICFFSGLLLLPRGPSESVTPPSHSSPSPHEQISLGVC